jgi:hypothetical protein
LNVTSGVVQASLVQILGTALAGTAAQIAAAFTKFFDKAAPTGTINSLPDAVAGAAGGLFLAGTNAATTVTGALTTTFTGNLTGTVAGVTGAVGSVTAGVTLAALESWVAHSGTAQAGAGSTITLAAGAHATDNFYTGMLLKIYGGTGIGQARTILSYVGGTKVATLDRAWITTPDNTSTYAVLWADQPKVDAALQTTTASVVGNVGGNLVGTIGGLAAQAKTDVRAEAVAALVTDTYSEPGQEAPGVNVSLATKINYLYKFMRNKITQTSTTLSVFGDDASTVHHKSTVSDDGTTYTRGEISTGP